MIRSCPRQIIASGLLAAAANLGPAVGAADQPSLRATFYAINVYGVMGGEGMALVIGPIHQESCPKAKAVFKEAAENIPVPPNMPLQISDCLRQPDLMRALYAPFNCSPVDSQKLPHSPGVHLWIYACHYL